MSDAPHTPDLSGRTLGDFQVLRKIGQGGMGQVYLARQLSLKRQVALKILRDESTSNPVALQRFQAEAEAVARISHPNVVQVYAAGEHDGLRFMALEYVDGRNLREHLERKGPPELPVALAVLKQVAAALQCAAESNLVHRDIKPENILLTRKVEVKVTDFGLSRDYTPSHRPLSLTQSGMTLGTPLYMSPEQVQGHPTDHRSDLYSLGVTAYHLLSGSPPFKGATAFDVALQHVQKDPEPLVFFRPDLPNDLCTLVHRLMAKNPADRPQTAKDVIRDLQRIHKGLAVPPPVLSASAPLPFPSGEVPVVPRPRRGAWRWLAAAGVLAVGAGGWLAYSLVVPKSEPPPVPTATGLPEVKLPAPPVSTREATLREKWEKSTAGSADHLAIGFDLGLLLVGERRWDEATGVFTQVEKSKPPKPTDFPVTAEVLGKLGRAVVLAHQDKWKESNTILEDAVKALPKDRTTAVQKLCFDHPAVGQAVAEAVNRNADNMPKSEQLPPLVKWLRTPSAVLGGPK